MTVWRQLPPRFETKNKSGIRQFLLLLYSHCEVWCINVYMYIYIQLFTYILIKACFTCVREFAKNITYSLNNHITTLVVMTMTCCMLNMFLYIWIYLVWLIRRISEGYSIQWWMCCKRGSWNSEPPRLRRFSSPRFVLTGRDSLQMIYIHLRPLWLHDNWHVYIKVYMDLFYMCAWVSYIIYACNHV